MLKDTLRGLVDEFDNHLDKILQTAGDARRCGGGGSTEHDSEQQTKHDGPSHRIHVNGPKPHLGCLSSTVSETPRSIRKLTISEVGQVVLYVVCRRFCAAAHRDYAFLY